MMFKAFEVHSYPDEGLRLECQEPHCVWVFDCDEATTLDTLTHRAGRHWIEAHWEGGNSEKPERPDGGPVQEVRGGDTAPPAP